MRRLLLCALFAAHASAAVASVDVDFDAAADFRSYHTYSWQAGTPARRETAQSRIVDAVDRELQAKGLRRVEMAPDTFVSVHVLVDRHDLEELSDPVRWEYLTGGTSVDPVALRAGTLVIDLTEARSGKRVWRGVASAAVDVIPEKNLKKLDKIVRKLLDRLPR